ncbi:MAG: DUF711 family protein [Halieaceae bacterium]|jgi:uncharacterized protein|nr:DUF711 family protein [Halieaceae bacterium]
MPQNTFSRREIVGLLGVGMAMPSFGFSSRTEFPFNIRTITAGIELASIDDIGRLKAVIRFLDNARTRFRDEGYVVQTIRVATQPLSLYRRNWLNGETIEMIGALDAIAAENGVMLNVGPVINSDDYDPEFGAWTSELIRATSATSLTVNVASSDGGVHGKSVRAAADAIKQVGRDTKGGEGNFRFAAIAHSPTRTPFYPAAFHEGPDAFGIGLESPNLLGAAVAGLSDRPGVVDLAEGGRRMTAALERAIGPIAEIAASISNELDWNYNGVDVSPAPGVDASIGKVIESLTGAPFGSSSTLSACAAVTSAIQGVSAETCGYSGLMLPPLEDPVLARRMSEGRFGVQELLLYSSVCGTGLDVVPLPGSTTVDQLAALIHDVASLANRWEKPLSARLFPVPGKAVGDAVSFDNPFMVDSHVVAP